MKLSDYVSVGFIAVIGTFLAYFLTNSFLGDPKDKSVSFEYIDVVESTLVEPDGEIFNSGAINPTVEIYVGDCVDLNSDGVIDQGELVECGQADPETKTKEEADTEDDAKSENENEIIDELEKTEENNEGQDSSRNNAQNDVGN